MDIKMSPAFKADLSKSIFAIIFFIVVYLLLLLMGVGLVICCVYAGIGIMAAHPMIWTLLLGIGIIGLGVLVLFFLIKFLFSSNKIDTSGMVEVKAENQPKLFEMVYGIADEVGTDKPKKIFLSAEVNASVFYNSGFWSMILPVRKNLQIGLGLINVVTESELKAILAHEFGHFSQKSMKVGSYVYQANRIIFNMLYEDSFYNSLLGGWSNIHGIFAIFATIAVKIIQAIQWILRQVYIFLNKTYMGLSRQMEFHADEVAANVAGSKPLIDSLLRLEFADTSFQNVLNFYDDEIKNYNKTENIYPQHTYVMKYVAEKNKISISNELPHITEELQKQFNKSKLVIKNQWASHPTTDDRIENLKRINISKPLINTSAWNLLSNREDVQKQLTQSLFAQVTFKETPNFLLHENFVEKFESNNSEFDFPEIYCDFYDNRDISEVNKSEPPVQTVSTVGELFNTASVETAKEYNWLKQDTETIEHIANGTYDIKTFDYDGVKYTKAEGKELAEKLKSKSDTLEEALKLIDTKSYHFFYLLASKKSMQEKLSNDYEQYYKSVNLLQEDVELYNKIGGSLEFIRVTTPFEEINSNFYRLQEPLISFKSRLTALAAETDITKIFSIEDCKDIQYYIKNNLSFFSNDRYDDENLKTLFTCLRVFVVLSNRANLFLKKEILFFQAELTKG